MLAEWLKILGVDPARQGLQLVPAERSAGLSPELPALLLVGPEADLAKVKAGLLEIYPPDTRLKLVYDSDREPLTTTLASLNPAGARPAAIFVEVRPLEELPRTFRALEHIVARLRAPDGCPWDRQQTHQSTKPFLLEEVYEAVDAIDREDWADLREELGDVLFHVLFQAQLAREGGHFNLGDVLQAINTKLVRRHPHVFGEVKAASIDEIWARWEELKRSEKAEASPLAGVPRAMPALAYAAQVLHRARRFGLALPEAAELLAVAAGRLAELRAAPANPARALGEALLALALYGAALELDPEDALRQANRRLAAAVERAAPSRSPVRLGDLFGPEEPA
ncbi:MAG: nucleoside triphosphate pyrophosphohydrolase [Chloroflexota bacterium]